MKKKPTLAVYGDSFGDITAMLNRHRENPNNRALRDRYNNAWPIILSKMLNAEVVCYARNGTNRQWTYNHFKETAGLHDYYVIVHTFYSRTFSIIESELMRFGYWRPEMEQFPIEEFRTAFEEYFRVFKDPETNQLAHIGFNFAFAKVIEDKKIPRQNVVHVFLDPDQDYNGPMVLNAQGLNDGTHNYTDNLSYYSNKEIEYLLKDPITLNNFIGEDLRPCHMAWVNNGKLAEALFSALTGQTRGYIDLEKILVPYNHPRIKQQHQELLADKDDILQINKVWDHVVK